LTSAQKFSNIHHHILATLAEKRKLGLTNIAKELTRRTGNFIDTKRAYHPLNDLQELGIVRKVEPRRGHPYYTLNKSVVCFDDGLMVLIYGREAVVLTYLCKHRDTCEWKSEPTKCPRINSHKQAIAKLLKKG